MIRFFFLFLISGGQSALPDIIVTVCLLAGKLESVKDHFPQKTSRYCARSAYKSLGNVQVRATN